MGLLAALAAALAYGAATILQATGVARLAAAGGDAAWRTRAAAMAPYAAGLVLDAAGFLAGVVALHRLPLFVVQSAIASSVAVTAVLAVLLLHAHLRRGDAVAVAAMVAGLVLLALSAVEGPPRHIGSRGHTGILLGVLPVAALLLAGLALRPRRSAATVLAATAGLGFAGVGVAARVLLLPQPAWRLASSRDAWAIVLYGAVALLAYGLALGHGSVTRVAAVTFAVETVIPAGIGLARLGDRVRPGWLLSCVVGFALTLGACLALAGHAEPVAEPQPLE